MLQQFCQSSGIRAINLILNRPSQIGSAVAYVFAAIVTVYIELEISLIQTSSLEGRYRYLMACEIQVFSRLQL